VKPPATSDKTSDTPYLLTPDLTPTLEPTEAVEHIAERAYKQRADRNISLQADGGNILSEGTKRQKKRLEKYSLAVESALQLTLFYASFSAGLTTDKP
jgi:hypothetical protein